MNYQSNFSFARAVFSMVIACGAVAACAQTLPSAGIADVLVLRQRLVRAVLPGDSAAIARVHELGNKYARKLLEDATWPGIDYSDQDRAAWKTFRHLDYTLVMAKSARLYRDSGKPDASLEAKVRLALKDWTDHDYRNPNWWYNQIGVPEVMGEIGCMMEAELPGDQIEKMIAIMRRSDWRKSRWTGGNLTWGVINEIMRGCLEENAADVAEGYERMYEEIKIVGTGEEGIQQDYSFHQHGRQLYNGGYGLFYGNDVGRFIAYARSTRFAIPREKMKLFAAYMLEGQQWMVRGGTFDYSASGRCIVRKSTAQENDWTAGPVSPAGAAYSLGHVAALLAAEPTQWQKEFSVFAERLNSEAGASDLVGNKQFWCSDYMTHRRPGFFTSVKMLSNRMSNGELVNGEGKKSEHLSDGANYLYLSGDEYTNIFPVWDWTKIPGTTAIQGTLNIGGRNPIGQRGQTAFAGGVSDGTYGACAMDLRRGHLSGQKAWFFFDKAYICLGSGIDLSEDMEHSVATDVNQTLLNGPVFTNESSPPVSAGKYESRGGIQWVYHNHVGYIFPVAQRVCLSVGDQSGRWSDIGAGSHDLVTEPVFDLWIEHGKACRDASYEYIVLPDIAREQMAGEHITLQLDVLANSDPQAVYNKPLKLLEAVFRGPGSLKTPFGMLQVDHGCLLMVRKSGDGVHITAANPENQTLSLSVQLGSAKSLFRLPGGNWAGSSVGKP